MLYFRWEDILKPKNHKKIYRAGTARINACGDSRLRGLRSRKPIGFRQWVVHREGNHKIIRKTRDFGYGADFPVIGEWEATATCTFTAKIKLK